MGARRIRRDQRQHDMKVSRLVNGKLKVKERRRRHTRMVELLKAGKLPYIPSIMSFICAELEKSATRLTQADVDQLVAKLSASSAPVAGKA